MFIFKFKKGKIAKVKLSKDFNKKSTKNRLRRLIDKNSIESVSLSLMSLLECREDYKDSLFMYSEEMNINEILNNVEHDMKYFKRM